MLLGIGIASDYGFNKWLGECPDEKWDHFLANYSANLPNSSDRAGSFRPFPIKSLWGRLLGTLGSREKRDSLFPLPPSTGHSRNSIAKDPTDVFSDDEYDKDFAKPYLHSQDLPYDDLPASPILLRKARSQNVEHKPHKARGFQKNPLTRKWPIKFGQDLSSDSSDDDSDAPQHINIRPWLKKMASTNSSSPTLVDQSARISLEHEMVQKARPKPQGGRSTAVSSDYEEDIGGRRSDSSVTQKDVGWRPGFLNRHSSLTKMNGISGGSLDGSHSSAPIAAVPATPSLIKALDRISVAQRDAFGPPSAPHALVSSLRPSDFAITTRVDGIPGLREVQGERSDAESDIEVGRREHLALGWDEFWKEVKHKATA
ncbi:hypothetical protein H0H87_009027 [Tephrocybe sp. NHM501043]|nr:hypothetical protein H0H87_009027 [Tephrocybe sp. NHM501043]